jgi:hypothetical protein
VLQRIAPADPAFRDAVFPLLIDCLFRSESAEGVHADVAAWIAGPFKDIGEAKDAVKRLKIDLEIDGILIEPVKKG